MTVEHAPKVAVMRLGAMRMAALGLAAALTVALGFWPGPSHAQPYPTRPIKIIVPTPAGGPVDVIARLTATYLTSAVGQPVVVDNRPGAGNTLGSKEAAQAEPDGYTLLYSSASGLVFAPMLQKNAGYDPVTSYDPIVAVAQSSTILVVHPSVPVKSVQELVAYAKANPGKVNFSSGGIGVLPHLIGEWFKSRAGIDIVHVPYRGGGPSINDLVGGQVQMTFEGTSVLLPLIETGKLRALAVTSAKRLPQLPDVPTMTESGFPGFVSTSWTGLLAPAHTPREVIDKLNAQVNEGLKSTELKAALAKVSNEPVGGTPKEFADTIKGDIDKWAPVVKALGLAPQ
jgi:tripartite-type tricarboxylate transporter receptor subunit TctC